MFLEARLHEIADAINANGSITISEIAERYGISEESARRDLRILSMRGLCHRTHGGAIRPGQVSVRPPENRELSQMEVYENYREIAKAAALKISQNDTVYITGGSFGYIILTYLPRDISYTVVVNNVDVCKELRAFDNIEVYMAGGRMRKSGSVVDSLAKEFVSRLHFDICFITGSGLTAEFGLSNGTDETAAFQRTVINNSRKKILLMPSGKVGKDSFIKVCDTEAFDELITDWDCPEDIISAIEEKGVAVAAVNKP